MSRASLLLLSCVTLSGACREGPTEIPSEAVAPVLVAAQLAIPATACTRSWVGGFGGLWVDPSRWSPVGVPGPSDVICIDAPGTYTVDLTFPADVRSLRIGGTNAEVTLVWAPPFPSTLVVADTLEIASGSELDIPSVGGHVVGSETEDPSLINDGRLTVSNPCACGGDLALFEFGRVRNTGTLDLTSPLMFYMGDNGRFINDGAIVGRSGQGGQIDIRHNVGATGSRWLQRAGTIVSSAPFQIWFDFDWSGGTLEPGSNTVSVWIGDVKLLNTTLVGSLNLFRGGAAPGNTVVTGQVGRNVALRMQGGDAGGYQFVRGVVGPTVNHGSVILLSNFGQTMDISFPGLTNNGELLIDGVVNLASDSVVNAGLIELTSGDALRFEGAGPGSHQLKNRGTIAATHGLLEMTPGTTFLNALGGTMTGPLHLDNATLKGGGAVGHVTAVGGSIQPGNPVGVLTVESADLDAGTDLVFEIIGENPSEFDQLVVSGSLVASGSFTVATDPLFAGGACGQLLPLITDGGSGGPAFGVFNGLALDASHAWRVHQAPGTTSLAGYDPGAGALGLGRSSLTVEEGGATDSYPVCLGPVTPSASVTVAPRSVGGQVVPLSPLTFSPSDWPLPRTVVVRALDDLVVEGPHQDVIEHDVTSSDPNYGGAVAPSLTVEIEDDDTEADLVMSVVSQQDNRFVGDLMETVFRVANVGPSGSSAPTVTSTPLVGLAFVSATGATCSVNGANVMTCAFSSLDPGTQHDFTVTFQGLSVGFHTQTLTASGPESDPNPANDAANYTQRVN